MDKLHIVVPAYNESENIRNLVDAWYPIFRISNKNNLCGSYTLFYYSECSFYFEGQKAKVYCISN